LLENIGPNGSIINDVPGVHFLSQHSVDEKHPVTVSRYMVTLLLHYTDFIRTASPKHKEQRRKTAQSHKL